MFLAAKKQVLVRSGRKTGFQWLQTLLIEAPVLTYSDPSLQYILDTDASNEAAGAVLSQLVEDKVHVVAVLQQGL